VLLFPRGLVGAFNDLRERLMVRSPPSREGLIEDQAPRGSAS
jgi:hypothetical protein